MIIVIKLFNLLIKHSQGQNNNGQISIKIERIPFVLPSVLCGLILVYNLNLNLSRFK